MKGEQENEKSKRRSTKSPKDCAKSILSRSRIKKRKDIWTEYCQKMVLETINKPWVFLSLGNQNVWNYLKILLHSFMAATSVHVYSIHLTLNMYFWLAVLAWKQLGQWEIVSWIYQRKIVQTTTFKRQTFTECAELHLKKHFITVHIKCFEKMSGVMSIFDKENIMICIVEKIVWL